MAGNSKRYGLQALYLIILIPVFLASCLGASSQIKINSNGSGTIKQEYRISHQLQSMGNTDGGESSLPLPTGKEDLERTVERVPGLRLVSYSQREDEKDLIINAEFAFDSPEALAALMENGDQQLNVDIKNKKIRLHLPAGESGEEAFKSMLIAAFAGYDFSFSISVPGSVKAAWYDESGKAVQKYPGTLSARNSTVEYTVPMGELVYLENSLELEITW